MDKIWSRLIIWLFEKYAYDYWVDLQMGRERKEIMTEHNLQTEEEYREHLAERQNRPMQAAYRQGRTDQAEQDSAEYEGI